MKHQRIWLIPFSVLFTCAGLMPSQVPSFERTTLPVRPRFALWDRFQEISGWGSAHGNAIAVGDVDSDGDLDVAYGIGTNGLLIAINRGNAGFDVRSISFNSGFPDSVLGLALADIDGDGDLDVIAAQTDFGIPNHEAINVLLLNDGNANFTMTASGTRLPTECTRGYSVAAADFDRDGDVDLLFGRGMLGQGLQNHLLLNTGNGFFTNVTATHLPGDQLTTAGMAVADLDSDGDLDIACANGDYYSLDPQTIYWNDGQARFTLSVLSPFPESGSSVVAEDFDLDGDLDLYFTIEAPRDRLFFNDGRGRFADHSHTLGTRPLGSGGGQAASLDFEGDGDMDLVLATSVWSQFLHLLVNDGQAKFTNTVNELLSVPSPIASRLAAADFDGDGDTDLFVNGNYGLEPRGLKVFLNLTTQLYTQNEVKLGAPYAIHFFADEGTVMFPFLATKPGRVDLGALGVLGLDPASLVALPIRVTNAIREARWSAPVPNDPGLRGVSLYAQAVSFDFPRTGRLHVTNWIVDVIR